MPLRLRVILVKPSKYGIDGFVERFRWGFIPNSTLAHMKSLTPASLKGVPVEVLAFDEYVQTSLEYLSNLQKQKGCATLLALVGVQSHQFQRALDLAAFARKHGVEHCVIGGPHPMTCDTTNVQNRGISFSLAEAESVWFSILEDAISGELAPCYGKDRRWHEVLDPPVLQPLAKRELRRYAVPLMGIYPARGCPYTCNFCSVIKIAGRQVRSQPVETTIASLRAAKAAGVRMVIFTSDNFNKYAEATDLLKAMIDEKIELPFFVQCDAQIYRQPELIALLAQAGCFQMFIGVESLSRDTLLAAHKFQNRPEHYAEIIALCRSHGITTHFSNIIGFPDDTEFTILDHLKMLREMRPDVASFYILTPIPGTEQYNDFVQQNLIFEQNLDRFDATRATWRHSHLSAVQLETMLFRCYSEFFNTRDVLVKSAGLLHFPLDFRFFARLFAIPGYSIQSRIAIRKKDHPMAGGTFRIHRDRDSDYLSLRREVFHMDLLPLPESLPLSVQDQQLNNKVRFAV